MKPQMNRVQPRRNPANSLVLGLNLSLQAAQDPGRLKPELRTTSSFVRVWSIAFRLHRTWAG